MAERRFYGPGNMAKRYFAVGPDYIRRKRPFDIETIKIPADEAEWATSRRRAQELFFWHRNHGLARREPHPMGKDLEALRIAKNAAHAERYRVAGFKVPNCYLETDARPEPHHG